MSEYLFVHVRLFVPQHLAPLIECIYCKLNRHSQILIESIQILSLVSYTWTKQVQNSFKPVIRAHQVVKLFSVILQICMIQCHHHNDLSPFKQYVSRYHLIPTVRVLATHYSFPLAKDVMIKISAKPN